MFRISQVHKFRNKVEEGQIFISNKSIPYKPQNEDIDVNLSKKAKFRSAPKLANNPSKLKSWRLYVFKKLFSRTIKVTKGQKFLKKVKFRSVSNLVKNTNK